MEGLDADMDIEQIERKIARMKREIAKKQRKLKTWEKAAMLMKNVSGCEVAPEVPVAADAGEVSGVTTASVQLDKDQDGPLTQAENPLREEIAENSDSEDAKMPASEDYPPKEDSQTAENAATSALRRSSRQPRSSYILNSDEFITLDFWYTRGKKKTGSQVSPESGSSPFGVGSEQAAQRLVFPAPPRMVAEQPIVDFCLPEDEFAAWKIQSRRKISLRSGARTVNASAVDEHPKAGEESKDATMKKNLDVPLLSKFQPVFSLDTSVRESVELVHCGRVVLDDDNSVCAIAVVQSSKISVFVEMNDDWKQLLKVPLFLDRDWFYKFIGFNSPCSMGLTLITDTETERAVWCYDLSPPGKELCLECTAIRKSRPSCTILSCVIEETLIYAQVCSKGTQLKTYRLDAREGKKMCCLKKVKDALTSLQPVMELKDAVIGFSQSHLYVWNYQTGGLCKWMKTPGNSLFHKCTFAQDESGLLMLGVVTGASSPKHHLIVVNPTMHTSRVLREYQDVVELPNQCLEDTARVGQHLVARGGDEVGRVAIWNFYSGNLVACLNDSAVSAVCSFPAECARDFLVVTGTQHGTVILYKLPFAQV